MYMFTMHVQIGMYIYIYMRLLNVHLCSEHMDMDMDMDMGGMVKVSEGVVLASNQPIGFASSTTCVVLLLAAVYISAEPRYCTSHHRTSRVVWSEFEKMRSGRVQDSGPQKDKGAA